MPLTEKEQVQLAHALQNTVTSGSALAQMVSYQFGENLDTITSPGTDLSFKVSELVTWAETHGRTAELIRAAQQLNPQSSAISKVVDSLPKSTRQDERVVPASTPKLSVALYRELIAGLLRIPEISEFEFRTKLLDGIPWQTSLPRDANQLQDLENMIRGLAAYGQLKSGAWPLVILADNARSLAEGTRAAVPLERVYKKLVHFYGRRAS